MTVRKLPNGRWEARLMRGGRRIRETFARRDQAQQFEDAVDLGRPIGDQTLRARFRKASHAAGIAPPLEYLGTARNAFLAEMLAAGVNPWVVSRLATHEDLSLLVDYTRRHVPLEQMRDAVELVEASRSGTSARPHSSSPPARP